MAMKKPKWVVEKEQAKKAAASETVWLFGLHAVRDALENPRRHKLRLVVTKTPPTNWRTPSQRRA